MLNSQTLAQTLITLSEQKDAETKINEFFDFLKERNLMGILPQIKNHVERISKEADSYNTLVISSPYTLDEKQIKEIKTMTKADADVSVETQIDEQLIGSFRARYQGRMYDGSLGNVLSQMNKVLNL